MVTPGRPRPRRPAIPRWCSTRRDIFSSFASAPWIKRKRGFQGNCKPNSVCIPLARAGENHSSEQPYPELWSVAGPRNEPLLEFPIWPCTRRGFPCPADFSGRRWSLTPPFHPWPAVAGQAVYFLWHFPSARLEACLPHVLPSNSGLRGAALYGVRTFLLRPKAKAILRSPETATNIAALPPSRHDMMVRSYSGDGAPSAACKITRA